MPVWQLLAIEYLHHYGDANECQAGADESNDLASEVDDREEGFGSREEARRLCGDVIFRCRRRRLGSGPHAHRRVCLFIQSHARCINEKQASRGRFPMDLP